MVFFNGASNITFTPNITITAIGGSNNIVAYGNDSANNINYTKVFFSVKPFSINLTLTLGINMSNLIFRPTGFNNRTFSGLEPQNQTSTNGCINLTNNNTFDVGILVRINNTETNLTYAINTVYNLSTAINLTTLNQSLIGTFNGSQSIRLWCWLTAVNRYGGVTFGNVLFNS